MELVPVGSREESARGIAEALARVQPTQPVDFGLDAVARDLDAAYAQAVAGVKVLIAHNRYRSAQPSGENVVVDDEARLLAEHGCEVELLQTHSDEIAGLPAAQEGASPRAHRVVARRTAHRADAIERFRPDVVHVHNTFPLLSPAALRAARASGAAVVATMHNFRPLCAAATFFRDGKSAPRASVAGRCPRSRTAATATPAPRRSRSQRRSRRTASPAPGARRSTATSPLPPSRARTYVQAGWAPERLVVKPNTAPEPGIARSGAGRGFVALARLSHEKGIDTLLDAWRAAGIDEPLTLIGSGDRRGRAPQTGEGLHNVSFAGQLPHAEALAVLATARALVVPSRWFEVFPRTIVEAYALGVPVLASRIGSLADVVEDTVTGVLVEPSQPAALAVALRTLAENDAWTQQLGRQARRRYEDELAPGPATRRLLEIYEDAVAQTAALEAA